MRKMEEEVLMDQNETNYGPVERVGLGGKQGEGGRGRVTDTSTIHLVYYYLHSQVTVGLAFFGFKKWDSINLIYNGCKCRSGCHVVVVMSVKVVH